MQTIRRLGLGLALAGLAAPVLANGLKPGLWEMRQSMNLPGMPSPASNQWTHCVKPEDAKQGPVFREGPQGDKKHDCRIENLKTGSSKVSYDVVCPGGKEPMRMHAEYRYTDTTFEGESRMHSGGRTLTFKMTGKYLGACKKP